MLRSRWFRFALAVGAGISLLSLVVVLRLQAGPLRVAFLDARIAAAIAGLAPELRAEVGTTTLVRSGWGVALGVSGLRLSAPDGTPLLALPALSVRPSFGALVRGRFVLARVDVAGASLALTRQPDGAWLMGAGESGAGVALAGLLAAPAEGASGVPVLPRVTLTRTFITVDDRRGGASFVLSDGDLLLTPRAGRIDTVVQAALQLTSRLPPVRGAVRLPVRVAASAAVSEAGALGDVTFTVTGGPGDLALGDDKGAPFPLAELAADGEYLPAVETLRLSRLAAVVGTSRVAAKTTFILGAAPLLAFDGTVDTLALAALWRLWPADLAGTARSWLLANVRRGTLRRCRVQLGLHGAAAGANAPASAPAKDAVEVACDFDGVTADYLAPLDPVRAATGSARLTTTELVVDVHAGEVGACALEGGTLVMDLTSDPARATITADVSGAAADVLALVDRPPLSLAAPLGITPQDLGGQSRVHAELHLPIKSDLRGSEIDVKATAALTDASLPVLIAGIGITGAALDVRVDGRTFDVTGTTTVTGLPAVTAPVQVAVKVAPEGRAQRVTLALDGSGLLARGSATLAGSTIETATVERLRIGHQDLSGTIRRRPGGDFEATLTGARLDLETPIELPARDPHDAAPLFTADYALSLRLGKVRLSSGVEIRNLRGAVEGSGRRLRTLDLSGALAPSGDFHATLDQAHRLTVDADQAGRILQALVGFEQIAGGRLELDARTDPRGPREFLEGTLLLHDAKVVRAPILAKILGIGSLGGIAGLLQGDGMPVHEARVPFRWETGRFTVQDGRAIGAVGLTADGTVDRNDNRCDVRGNVIPAYTLSNALGKIPLLGRFLGASEGRGVFGIDYRVSGTLQNPDVQANPLAALSPSRLRALFVDPFSLKDRRGR